MRDMGLKLSRYFYLRMGKPLDRHCQVRSPYYQAAHQKTPDSATRKHLFLSPQSDRSDHLRSLFQSICLKAPTVIILPYMALHQI